MSDGKVKLSELTLEQPLNILCHPDDIEVVNDRKDVMQISAQDTLAMAAKFTARTWAMAKADEDFKRRLRIVFPELDIAADPRELADYPIGIRHVVGLIVCTNMAINTGRKPFWQFPETYLHPRSQANLASLAISWVKDSEEAITEAQAAARAAAKEGATW